MVQASDIQVINTVTPQGDSTDYTINFTLVSDNFSIGSGRVMVSEDNLNNVTEKDKPQLILDILKNYFGAIDYPDKVQVKITDSGINIFAN